MKRRRAREHDQEVAREQADRRRDELLARLRGEQAAPAEAADEPEAANEPETETHEAQPSPAASEEPPDPKD